jgi:TolA-binding protein
VGVAAAALVAVATLGLLAASLLREHVPTIEPAAGIVANDDGTDEAVPAVEGGDEAPLETIRLATSGDEHVVRTFSGGLRLSLSGDGLAVVSRLGERDFSVRLDRGLLVADVPETSPRTRLVVEADNARVTVRGTLFAVRARDRLITEVRVERGRVEVLSKVNQTTRLVRAGETLRIESLAVASIPADSPSLLGAFLTVVPPEEQELVQPSKLVSQKGPSLYEHAMALRKQGRNEEAVEAFLEGAKKTSGLERQRCLYQAASMSLGELQDPDRAIELAQTYIGNYPKGLYAEDAYILMARAYMASGESAKAHDALEKYLKSFPGGTQATLAHLLLGKILATTMGKCDQALPHFEMVLEDEGAGPTAKQAENLIKFCKKKKQLTF